MTPTEQPTRRRLERAALEGNVAFSQALVGVGTLAVLLAAMPFALRFAWDTWETWMRLAIAGTPEEPSRLAMASIRGVALGLSPVAATAILVSVAQTGGALSWPAALRRRTLDAPGPGARERAAQAIVGGAVAALVSAAGVWLVFGMLRKLPTALGDAGGALSTAAGMAEQLGWLLWCLCAVAAVIDVAVARSQWVRRLRMTRAEVKQELRETTVAPELRSRRQARHDEYLGLLDSARQARLVLTDGDHLAVALRYDAAADAAPAILRVEYGALTAAYVSSARAANVHVADVPALAWRLSAQRSGTPIPVDLYDSIARLMR